MPVPPTYPAESLERFLARLDEQSPKDPLTGQRVLLESDFDRLIGWIFWAEGSRESARRILARWGDFDAAVENAQRLMRASGKPELLEAAANIDQVRQGIGGQP